MRTMTLIFLLWSGVYLTGLVLCVISQSPYRVYFEPFYPVFLGLLILAHSSGLLLAGRLLELVLPEYRSEKENRKVIAVLGVFSIHYAVVTTAIMSRLFTTTSPREWPEWLFLLVVTVMSAGLVLFFRRRSLSVMTGVLWTAGVVPLAGLLAFFPRSGNVFALLVLVLFLLYVLPSVLSLLTQDPDAGVVRMVVLGVPVLLFAVVCALAARAETAVQKAVPLNEDLPEPRPNVVLIVLDAARASHLASYGYHRNTMPMLKEWADRPEVLTFARTYVEANATLPSHGSLFTGLYPSRHGAYSRKHGGTSWNTSLDSRHETLSELLAEAGYLTSALVGPRISISRSLLDQGFHYCDARGPLRIYSPLFQLIVDNVQRLVGYDFSDLIYVTNVPYRRAERLAADLRAQVAHSRDRQFFIFANFLDPHSPYEAPDPFGITGRDCLRASSTGTTACRKI